MNKQKNLISTVTMGLMLLLVSFVQAFRINSLSFLESTNFANDVGFLTITLIFIVAISVFAYYLPMRLMFEYDLKFNISFSPNIHITFRNKIFTSILKPLSRRYLRLNVVRC